MVYLLIVIVIAIIVTVAMNVIIVPQSEAYVIERLGAYHSIWNVGIHVKIPYIERVANKVSLKEDLRDFAPQPVITSDNVEMFIDSVVYFQVTNPKLYTYGINNPMAAIESLTATTLRNIIGELDLDESLTSKDTINTKMRAVLDEVTNSWGVKVNRVEVKNIEPPQGIKDSMEGQMRAERKRREDVLIAEGQKEASILKANGDKEAAILRAQGDKKAQILKSEAVKEQKRLIAEGEAQEILNIQRATAHGYKMIKAAGTDKNVVALRSLEALERVADGKATKVIIPSDLQDIAGLVSGISEMNEVEDIDDTNVLFDDDGNKL